MTDRSLAHCVATLCDVPATRAFAYLADAGRLGEWALGCWNARPEEDDLVRGTSLFDGSPAFVRVRPIADSLSVDYEVGGEPGKLVRRIAARVVGGDELGGDARRSLVILLAWRTDSMDDERWHRLTTSHDTEILMLRERIERSGAA
jgi:hypothetical protein